MENGRRPEAVQIFLEDIKFEHSLFALPFAYLGLFLAEEGFPRFFPFFWVSVAMVSFRTFAMAMNRLLDHGIDAKNPRTRYRALPGKKLPVRFFRWAAFFSFLFFLLSAWMLGSLCFFLSPLPIVLAVIYPLLKRLTWLSHAVLGIILGISPYGSWLASRGEFAWTPGFLLAGVACWVSGFDILYSLQDFDFDRANGLQSVPAKFGKEVALGIARWLHGLAVLSWAAVGWAAGLYWIYGLGLAAVTVFLVREHWLIFRFGLAKINQAFFTMNAGVSLVLFLAAAADVSLT